MDEMTRWENVLMKNVNFTAVHPQKMTDDQKDELVSLHQQYITLERSFIIEYLQKRDRIYLYYSKNNGKLIATAGVQYIIQGRNLLIYIGNTVIDEQYAHEACLAHTLTRTILYALLRYPFKKKYWCALTCSRGSFAYFQKYQPCWPNPHCDTPLEMTALMEECTKRIGITEYKLLNGNVITYDLRNKLDNTFHVQVNDGSTIQNKHGYFKKINPYYMDGEQIFMLGEFRFYKLINTSVASLHHKLIKNPKLYHAIKKKSIHNPIYSFLLIIGNLFYKKIKFGVLAIAVLLASWSSSEMIWAALFAT